MNQARSDKPPTTPDIDASFDTLTEYLSECVEAGIVSPIASTRLRDRIEWLRQDVAKELGDKKE